jgi:hypothetical protein
LSGIKLHGFSYLQNNWSKRLLILRQFELNTNQQYSHRSS